MDTGNHLDGFELTTLMRPSAGYSIFLSSDTFLPEYYMYITEAGNIGTLVSLWRT